MIRNRFSEERRYWANFCIASSQVFLGIAAATLFTGSEIDTAKILVILYVLMIAILFAFLGSRLLR